MVRPSWILPLLVGVTLVGLAGFVSGCGRGAGVAVEVARVEKRAVFRSTVTASGEIVAVRYADLGSSVMGKLVSLPVQEGDRVREGQVVARIDAVPAASDAEAAARALPCVAGGPSGPRGRARDEAERALARGRALHEQGLVPQSDLDALQTTADATPGAGAGDGEESGPGAGTAHARSGDVLSARPRSSRRSRGDRDPAAGARRRDGRGRDPEHAWHDADDDLRSQLWSTPR